MFGFAPKHDWFKSYSVDYGRFTPDMALLENREWHLLFVYNQWQTTQSEYFMLGDPEKEHEKLAVGITKADNLVMWKKKLGNETYPFVLETTPDQQFGRETYLGPAGTVHGQLFKVRPMVIKGLDMAVLNGVQFDRKRVHIEIPHRLKNGSQVGEKLITTVKAWMYMGRPDFWYEQLNPTSFAPVKTFIQNKPKQLYYFYDHKFESDTI